MPKLLSIGRFAKLCHTTTDTLIHYDDIGLFSPAELTAHRRRYYHISQCYTFKTIQFLAEQNLSLTDIRTILSAHSLPHLESTLNQQLNELECKKQYLKCALLYIKKQQLLQDMYSKIPIDGPFFISHPQPCSMFANLLQSHTLSNNDVFQSLKHHIDICLQNHIYPFPFGFYIKKESLRVKDSHPLLVYSPLPDEIENNRTLIRPAGKFAALIHKGSLDSINHSLQKLKEHISDNTSYLAGDTFITCYDNCSLIYRDTCYLIETHMIPLTQALR